MELKGIDMKFFDTLNEYLQESRQKEKGKQPKTLTKIQTMQEELDKRATAEKTRVEERLELELSGIDPLDIKTRSRIWEEYYDTLDEMGDRYNNGLIDILSKVASSTII